MASDRDFATVLPNGWEIHGLHAMVTSAPPASDSARRPGQGATDEPLLSIAAVERETGLGKDTLRVWERRYGFPLPRRDASGVRGYPRGLVDRLGLIRRALLAGQRPGRLLALPPDELDALLAAIAAKTGPTMAPRSPRPAGMPNGLDVADCLAALRSGGAPGLRHWLTRGLARMGLGAFVVDGIAPLAAEIGAAWVAGGVAVYEEHLFSEAVQSVLRAGLLPFQAGLERSAPHVLLTTVPGEEHGLGLLMAEAMMTLEACRCLPLGVQTPIADIVAASRACAIDVVALSFSASQPAADVAAALAELRRRLPARVAIWAGGAAPALRSLRMAAVRAPSGLEDIAGAVAEWRRDAGVAAD